MFSHRIDIAVTLLIDKARYLLARLLLRKTGRWYRVKNLKYASELGITGIQDAMAELCCLAKEQPDLPRSTQKSSSYCDPVVIDLTLDEDDPPEQNRQMDGISDADETLEVFAEDESRATLDELVSCLDVEELKNMSKTMKVQLPAKVNVSAPDRSFYERTKRRLSRKSVPISSSHSFLSPTLRALYSRSLKVHLVSGRA